MSGLVKSVNGCPEMLPMVLHNSPIPGGSLSVVVAVTVVLMLALVQVFDFVGEGISDRRSIIEVSGELRAAVMRLQRDLDGLTVTTLPPAEPQAGEGYLEIIEGHLSDRLPVDGDPTVNSLLGDTDDLLMFTARSEGEPFVGRYGANTIESNVAEIVWWIGSDPANSGKRHLYRRVFLVRPDLNDSTGIISNAAISSFVSVNDISVRLAQSGALVANSLADLTKRENRFGHDHDRNNFPHRVLAFVPDVNRYNEDLILFQPLAFDVRVYDPNAPMYQDPQNPGAILSPGDRGLYDPVAQGFIRRMNGAYVDLYYERFLRLEDAPDTYFFAGPGHRKSQLHVTDIGGYATYDTWSLHYEYDGRDQDFDDKLDEGTNGLDDQFGTGLDDLGSTGVDDFGERETSPPYPYPLRGLQVKVRVYEPDSQTVHQVTVTGDFLPE